MLIAFSRRLHKFCYCSSRTALPPPSLTGSASVSFQPRKKPRPEEKIETSEESRSLTLADKPHSEILPRSAIARPEARTDDVAERARFRATRGGPRWIATNPPPVPKRARSRKVQPARDKETRDQGDAALRRPSRELSGLEISTRVPPSRNATACRGPETYAAHKSTASSRELHEPKARGVSYQSQAFGKLAGAGDCVRDDRPFA